MEQNIALYSVIKNEQANKVDEQSIGDMDQLLKSANEKIMKTVINFSKL